MNLYEDIAKRTNGEIYIGVVGPVRSGKSTFVKKFLDTVIIPNMDTGYQKERTTDESPQSASGRTIMTTEPKFVPDEAVSVTVGNAKMKARLIDCVGYFVEGAMGASENGEARMVATPWSDEPMEFEKAAETGTKKVIADHSTVGIVVTTDGTIGDIERQAYIPAEERVIKELKELGKPFAIVLNSASPTAKDAQDMAMELEKKYNAPVALVNATELNEEDFNGIFELLLGQFDAREIIFNLPKYLTSVENSHWLKQSLISTIKASLEGVKRIDDGRACAKTLSQNEYVLNEPRVSFDMGNGKIIMDIELLPELYYKIMSEICGIEIGSDEDLFLCIKDLAEAKRELNKFTSAIDQVGATGYGIVLPSVDDMTLDEPELIRQGGSYGIKIKATAPSIHMIRASIEAEVTPIVGTREQAQEIVRCMLDEFEDDPTHLWEFNMLGKSLFDLTNDALKAKLDHISSESRVKLSDTLTRVINEGSNGLICIIL